MNLALRRILSTLLIVVFLLGVLADPACAQQKKGDQQADRPPYDVPGLPHSKVWVPWVFAFLFAAGTIIVAFKNPHRSSTERT